MENYDSFRVYLHNKNQVITEKTDDIFGQKDIPINVGNQLRNSVQFGYYSKEYKIKRTHWKAMDKPEKKCSEETTEVNTTVCITNYIEQTTGCSMGLYGSNPEIPM